MSAAEVLLDKAGHGDETDPVIQRVQIARVPILYVVQASDRLKGEARATLLEEFLAFARQVGITHISEGQSLNEWAKKMGAE